MHAAVEDLSVVHIGDKSNLIASEPPISEASLSKGVGVLEITLILDTWSPSLRVSPNPPGPLTTRLLSKKSYHLKREWNHER